MKLFSNRATLRQKDKTFKTCNKNKNKFMFGG